jgi:hypothetical protein
MGKRAARGAASPPQRREPRIDDVQVGPVGVAVVDRAQQVLVLGGALAGDANQRLAGAGQ